MCAARIRGHRHEHSPKIEREGKTNYENDADKETGKLFAAGESAEPALQFRVFCACVHVLVRNDGMEEAQHRQAENEDASQECDRGL